VGDPGKNDLLDVPHHGVEALARFRRTRGKALSDLSRLDPRENGEALDSLVVVDDPVDQLFSIAPELLRRHVIGHRFVSESYLSLSRYLAMVWS
jgi:hypothetical protein